MKIKIGINGIDNKISKLKQKGNPLELKTKYESLAKDAPSAGDRVAAENKRELMASKGRTRFPDLIYPEKMSEDQDAIKFKILDYKPREWDKDQPGVLKERSRKDAALDKINFGK